MNVNFIFFSDINLVFLGVFFLVAFVFFNWGIILLLLAKKNKEKIKKGKKLLFSSFIIFFLFILTVFALSLFNYFFKKEDFFQSAAKKGEEFPPSFHSPKFPPAPEFINIGKYHFRGAWPLKEKETIGNGDIYAILCKKNQKYDILYINEGESNFAQRKQYGCWLKKCGQNPKNLYLALFQMPSENYDFDRKQKIENDLIHQTILPCAEKTEEGQN